MVKSGDFSTLARDYIHRPGYSETVLKIISGYVQAHHKPNFCFADIGAGTGKWTEMLLAQGLKGVAVEPNDAMRAVGIETVNSPALTWHRGSAENTGLKAASYDWVSMASSFHWTDRLTALAEFQRILKPGGHLTLLWNPRDIQSNALQQEIDDEIRVIVPELKRVSSGANEYTNDIEKILIQSKCFTDVFFLEAQHEVCMDKQRYLGVWRSVNDIQAQAGPERFALIMQMIENKVKDKNKIVVPYRTRSWTATVVCTNKPV